MADITWTGTTDGDLDKAGNWDAGVPTTGDNVIIPSGTANNPTTGTCVGGDITIAAPIIGGSYSAQGNLTLNGAVSDGVFTGSNYLYIYGGASGGTFNGGIWVLSAISGGTYNNNILVLGTGSITGGTYSVSIDLWESGASITDGIFNGAVSGAPGSYITGGTFHSTVSSGIQIQGGTYSSTSSVAVGSVTSGTFYGSFSQNSGDVTGGTFYGSFTFVGTSQVNGHDVSGCHTLVYLGATWTKAKGINGSGILGML